MFPQSESETEGLLLSWSGRECTCTGARAIQPRRACGSFLRGGGEGGLLRLCKRAIREGCWRD
jgi:hypothetical protein